MTAAARSDRDRRPARRRLGAWSALAAAAILCGCQSTPARNTRAVAKHTYRGARAVTHTTSKVARATGGIAQKAWQEIPAWHEIRSGDTFHRIAAFYGVPTEKLQALNPLVDPLKLQIGRKLRLRQ